VRWCSSIGTYGHAATGVDDLWWKDWLVITQDSVVDDLMVEVPEAAETVRSHLDD